MSVKNAENAARNLLSSSWWADSEQTWPLPVDPFELAEGLGLSVRRSQLSSDESGRIVIPEVGSPVITVNSLDHPNRQRFTCAHEVGHYVRRTNRNQVGARTFTDRRATLAGLGVDQEEIFANQFAAALLMPSHLVRKGRQRGRSIESEAHRFGTSTQAYEVRLRNLGLTY